jgi:hypothetical protein
LFPFALFTFQSLGYVSIQQIVKAAPLYLSIFKVFTFQSLAMLAFFAWHSHTCMTILSTPPLLFTQENLEKENEKRVEHGAQVVSFSNRRLPPSKGRRPRTSSHSSFSQTPTTALAIIVTSLFSFSQQVTLKDAVDMKVLLLLPSYCILGSCTEFIALILTSASN